MSTNKKYFFIGVAGVGMSAIAQYLVNTGNFVGGSDRLFLKNPNHHIRQKLETENIKTYAQGNSIIDEDTDFVVVSTAIENTVPEFRRANELNIPIIHRSEMLQQITESKKTIAIAGTSGKSSTTAILYTILSENNFSPSMLNGSGLIRLQKENKIGNSVVGNGDWLIIEADESDGTLVNYSPEIGVLLNIDRDHKEFAELEDIFSQFASHVTEQLIVNCSNNRSEKMSNNSKFDFGTSKTDFFANNIFQTIEGLNFSINNVDFFIPAIGLHNIENATAAISVANYLGIELKNIAAALKKYDGINRRMQIIGTFNKVLFIDDYAHNPAKIESAIRSVQNLSKRVFAFFQPHGFAPLKFFKDDLIDQLVGCLRDTDEFYLSEIFYAGGTANKVISSQEVVDKLTEKNINAFLSSPRENFANQISDKIKPDDIVIIMGARDPSLSKFSEKIFSVLSNIGTL